MRSTILICVRNRVSKRFNQVSTQRFNQVSTQRFMESPIFVVTFEHLEIVGTFNCSKNFLSNGNLLRSFFSVQDPMFSPKTMRASEYSRSSSSLAGSTTSKGECFWDKRRKTSFIVSAGTFKLASRVFWNQHSNCTVILFHRLCFYFSSYFRILDSFSLSWHQFHLTLCLQYNDIFPGIT